MKRLCPALAAMAVVLCSPIATAAARPAGQDAPATTMAEALQARIDELPGILAGTGDFQAYFSPTFKAQVSKEKFAALMAKIGEQAGKPLAVESVTPLSAYAAKIAFGYEKAVATIKLAVDPEAPHRVTGLFITGVQPRDDSVAKLKADFRALPGDSGFGIYALDGGVSPVAALNDETAAPLGSAFKLWVLAEAARQVNAGARHWDDVVRLGERSLPSGETQKWPAGSPVTLHTLATLMISISDNTATDTLIRTLGRDRVDAMVATSGVADPARSQPVLTTMQAFRLKRLADTGLVDDWAALSPAARRALIADHRDALAAANVEPGMFGGKPVAPQVEWFASPRDEARVLDWLRRNAGDDALAILAVNAGTAIADRFDYIGYKGGSEPGVVSANYLVRTGGTWFAVTGNWHRADTKVETLTFFSLMNRALALAAESKTAR